MKKNTNVIIDFLYYLLHAGLLSSIVVLCFSDLLGISELTLKHGTILFLSIVFLSFIKELNKRQQIYVIILGIMLLVFLIISSGKEKSLLFVQDVLYLPFNKDRSIIEDRTLAEFVWIFLMSAAAGAIQLLFEKNFLLKIFSAFTIGGGLFLAMFSKQQIPKAAVVFSILYCVLVIIEWIQTTWRKQRNERSMHYILWIMPFLILYISLLCLMPTPETPYGWQWVKRIYHNAEYKVTMYVENVMNRKKENMDTALSGFSEKAGLFSEIRTEQKPLMNIKVINKHNFSLYLAGKVYNSFDGRIWKSLNLSNDMQQSLDMMETVYALERYNENSSTYNYENILLNIEYQFFHTNYMLTPSKTWKINKSAPYRQEGADYVFYRKAGYGTEYLLQYYQLNTDRELLNGFLQCELEDNEILWEKIVKDYSEEKITLGDLYSYRENVHNQYLKNIELSPEVKEWLSDVTADAGTDIEKLYCVEMALSDMQYNTKPGKLPETVTDATSFLDYFLLEKKEGYCSHFATSFVLLAQSMGFPSRYVQGFCTPVGNEKETIVYSNTAHAWPEVYIDGKGWISFEPTPGYESHRYTARKEDTDKKVAVTDTELHKLQEDISLEEQPLGESTEEITENQEEQNIWFSYIWKVIILIFITGILVFAADIINEKRREERRNISEKYRIAFLQNLQIIAMLGCEKEEAETYHELAERIRSSDAVDYEIQVEFIETYENALYGTKETSEQDLKSCLIQKEKLLEELKKHMGGKYLFCKIKLYIIRYR